MHCSVPRLMGYAHVASGVRVSGSGVLMFEESSKDVLGEGREVAEVITVRALQDLCHLHIQYHQLALEAEHIRCANAQTAGQPVLSE